MGALLLGKATLREEGSRQVLVLKTLSPTVQFRAASPRSAPGPKVTFFKMIGVGI